MVRDYDILASFFLVEISSSLSVFGSVSIVYLISKKSEWRHSIFHRIMMGMCLSDFIFSVGNMLHLFMLPAETGVLLAFGNDVTCSIAGFSIAMLTASSLYSCVLSTYFFLTITRGWNEEKASKVLEPWIHIVSLGFPLIPASMNFAFGGYKPSVLMVCGTDKSDEASKAAKLLSLTFSLLTVLPALIGFVLIWLMYAGVRRQHLRNQRYRFAASDRECQHKQTKAVATQALFYSLAFLNTFLAIILFAVAFAALNPGTPPDVEDFENIRRDVFYLLQPLYVMLPLQGVLNWVIYIRPNLMRWRTANEDKSLWWAYQKVLSGEAIPRTGGTSSCESPRRSTVPTEQLPESTPSNVFPTPEPGDNA